MPSEIAERVAARLRAALYHREIERVRHAILDLPGGALQSCLGGTPYIAKQHSGIDVAE